VWSNQWNENSWETEVLAENHPQWHFGHHMSCWDRTGGAAVVMEVLAIMAIYDIPNFYL
jgi:hypothetical protein